MSIEVLSSSSISTKEISMSQHNITRVVRQVVWVLRETKLPVSDFNPGHPVPPACARVNVRVCVRAGERACVQASVRASVRACVCACGCLCAYVCARARAHTCACPCMGIYPLRRSAIPLDSPADVVCIWRHRHECTHQHWFCAWHHHSVCARRIHYLRPC